MIVETSGVSTYRTERAVVLEYFDLGLTFYCDTADTNVEEIHLIEWVPTPETGADNNADRALSNARIKPRRFRAQE